MSTRSAPLLMELAGHIELALRDPASPSVNVPIGHKLAGAVVTWAQGYREHLDHRAEEEKGQLIAGIRVHNKSEAEKDAEALERVRAMVDRKASDDLAWQGACRLVTELLGYVEKENSL